jgi:hypothetical protein
MPRLAFRCVRRARSVPCGAGMGSGRRAPYLAAPDNKRLWGTRLGTFFCPTRPKYLWGMVGGRDWRCSYTVISSFVSFTEGYLGLWTNIELWARLHNLRAQPVQDPYVPPPKPMVVCGSAMILPRRNTMFIRVSGLESCRKWQKTFFYVKNV